MPKKTKVIEVEENEPVGAQEVEEVEEAQEAAPEVEEIKTKPKRLLSEKQLETLALARVKAAEVKKKNKEEKLKALSLSKKENETSKQKTNYKRCPNGTRRNKITGLCEKSN